MAKIIFIGRLCRQLVASYGATPQSHSKDSRKHGTMSILYFKLFVVLTFIIDISKIRPILIKIYDESHEIWMTETLKTFAEGLGSWLDRENWALKERYTGVWGGEYYHVAFGFVFNLYLKSA